MENGQVGYFPISFANILPLILLQKYKLWKVKLSQTPKTLMTNSDYFIHLYILQTVYLINDFLENITLPTLTDEDKAILEQPISKAEIGQAIKSMKNRKTPGPGGYPIEFYKAFASKLVPLLRAVYVESLKQEKLPTSMTQATISVRILPSDQITYM